MIIHRDIVQGSPEWFAARAGIPTASCFGKILTATGKLSTQATGYMHQLLAERLTGSSDAFEGNAHTERGTELEPQARAYYGLVTGHSVEEVGFCTLDDGSVGCSPDGLVGEDGGVEIKCPSAQVHIGYLIDGKVPTKYVPQVQGSLWVTGLEWWDTLCYYPGMPPVLVRSEPDLAYHRALEDAMEKFLARFEKAWQKVKGL